MSMYAILNSENFVIGWCWYSELDRYKDFKTIEMTLENSPATIDGKWDGQKFIHPDDLSIIKC